MGEFNFYGSYDDSMDMLQDLIQTRRYSFVVDMRYSEPKPLIFKDIDDLARKQIAIRNSVFIWIDAYSMFPPYFFGIQDGIMDIRLNHCGPGLDFKLATTSRSEGKTRIGLGWLFLPPKFYHPISGEPYKISDDIRNEYYYVRKIISHRLERRYFPSRRITTKGKITPIIETIWIGKKGLNLLETDDAFISIYQTRLSAADLKKNKKDVQLPIDKK